MEAPSVADPPGDLAARVRALHWYHTIELAPGIVTPGYFDTRAIVAKLPLPTSLAGRRCLDVGTWDGFWAFELERRGASSVTAIDIEDPGLWDWPPHMRVAGVENHNRELLKEFKSGAAAFSLAREALGSAVQRLDLSVYELDPAVVGTFDFVFLGSLLLHLRDPIGALERVRSVCVGEAVIAETVEAVPSLLRPRTASFRLDGSGRPWWWMPNVAGLHRMVRSAGFEILERTGMYFLPTGAAHPRPPLRKLARYPFTAAGREMLIGSVRGIPHAAVAVRPIGVGQERGRARSAA
jgi:tRNA (mo5U34)-methyltransferase